MYSLYRLSDTHLDKYIWRAERKYWREVKRSILSPFPLLYRQPTIYGTSYKDMSRWQMAASFREQKEHWNREIRRQVQDMLTGIEELRRSQRSQVS